MSNYRVGKGAINFELDGGAMPQQPAGERMAEEEEKGKVERKARKEDEENKTAPVELLQIVHQKRLNISRGRVQSEINK